MEIQNILTLIQAFTENSLTELKVEDGGVKVLLKKDHYMQDGPWAAAMGDPERPAVSTPVVQPAAAPQEAAIQPAAAVQAAAVPSPQPAAAVLETNEKATEAAAGSGSISSDKVVVSPLVGIFYSASSPEAESFVKVGDTVKKGQVLGIIEAMKLMNEIESDYDGVVEAILVKNEDVVEYGQPLFRIR